MERAGLAVQPEDGLTVATALPAGAPVVSHAVWRDDVCLLVEGTYPFVAGGVSAWVHDILRGHPELKFSIVNVGSHPGAYGAPRYVLPEHASRLSTVYCQDSGVYPVDGAARAALDREIRTLRARSHAPPRPSRVLRAIRRMHLEDGVDDELLADLTCGDLSVGGFLHGHESFELLRELAERTAPTAPFLDFFWHFRAIHVPILRLLDAPTPPARCYHAVSTGYAGLLGAAFSLRSGRPLIITEHGIYSRERSMELARASWIKDPVDGAEGFAVGATLSPLRQVWTRSFRALAALAYHRASRIVTLSDVNRRRQIADGAPPAKIAIVPNGVDVPLAAAPSEDTPPPTTDTLPPLRVGFVGRVVPIKDVTTFIKACHLAMTVAELDVRIIGPDEEDPAYAARCRDLVEMLGRGGSIKFVGPQPAHAIYGALDVLVLTSFSEGQPLVILEAYAAGLPVIATDVGACREMIEGRSPADRRLGPSGFVTRVANPTDTAAAIVRLYRDPALRRRLGDVGCRRVLGFYKRHDMIESYRSLYREMVTP